MNECDAEQASNDLELEELVNNPVQVEDILVSDGLQASCTGVLAIKVESSSSKGSCCSVGIGHNGF